MSFENPQLSDAITVTQRNADDGPTNNRMAPDDLNEYVNGSRLVFPLGRRNIVAGSLQYIADGGNLIQLDPTNLAFGLLTLPTAPQKTLECYYYYQNFTTTDIQGFIDQALTEMDYTEATAFSPDGIQPALIPLALFNAVCFFAAAYAMGSLMKRFAENFNSETEGTSLEQSEIYKAYKACHDRNLADGVRVREQYWGNQTRSNRPYTNSTNAKYRGFRQMPRR